MDCKLIELSDFFTAAGFFEPEIKKYALFQVVNSMACWLHKYKKRIALINNF
jgi:hypothetical protein